MGYIGIAAFVTVVVGIVTVILMTLPDMSGQLLRKELRITIPENLDYSGIFDDIFGKYTRKSELVRVKTVNMGSLYELNYTVDMKNGKQEKEMLDEIRCRNGNLPIVCGRRDTGTDNL